MLARSPSLALAIRLTALAVLTALSSATSCVTYTAIAVTPPPGLDADSVADGALAVAAGVATRHDLQASLTPDEEKAGWIRCFAREVVAHLTTTLTLCGKIRDGEMHFLLSQTMTSRFTAVADTLRHNFLAALRAQFGESSVRECQWENDYNPHRSGCAPIAARPE
jgi:hypothetical protein